MLKNQTPKTMVVIDPFSVGLRLDGRDYNTADDCMALFGPAETDSVNEIFTRLIHTPGMNSREIIQSLGLGQDRLFWLKLFYLVRSKKVIAKVTRAYRFEHPPIYFAKLK